MTFALVAAVPMALVSLLALHEAQARGTPGTTTLRMTAAGAGASAAGRMRFRTRRGTTYMSATFRRMAPDTMHTLHWDAIGQDDPQFMTDHHGRARLRHMAVPDGAMTGGPRLSVTTEDGDAVLVCDPDSMPWMHDGQTDDPAWDHDAHHGSMHDADGGMMGGGMMHR